MADPYPTISRKTTTVYKFINYQVGARSPPTSRLSTCRYIPLVCINVDYQNQWYVLLSRLLSIYRRRTVAWLQYPRGVVQSFLFRYFVLFRDAPSMSIIVPGTIMDGHMEGTKGNQLPCSTFHGIFRLPLQLVSSYRIAEFFWIFHICTSLYPLVSSKGWFVSYFN